ncbi:UvrD-helicase domain-containing protein [Chlamydiifrater volucris]|uniref:UvrD-helicase domain-containing protein n=1 Tax=Chlamydiifrater volucris TaxID=2681470 RepID=UPI001BD0F624|nr:UvrD-helicase domain-containing protein [Chlamydiifrater volucris]
MTKTEQTVDFNVANLESSVRGKFFLDASAGTGKTFAIENIILRFVLSGDISCLDKVLVMTFTRAATEELKTRIKRTLLSAKKNLKKLLDHHGTSIEDRPYYLSPGISQEEVKQLYIRVRSALSTMERSSVYTIHGFCRKILDNYLPGFQIPAPPPGMTRSQSYQEAISYYLSQDLWKEVLFPQQFHFLAYQHNPNKPGSNSLTQKLKESLKTNQPDHPTKDYFSKKAGHYALIFEPLLEMPWEVVYKSLDAVRKELKKEIPITETDLSSFLHSLYNLKSFPENDYSLETSAPSIFLHYRLAMAFSNNVKKSAQQVDNVIFSTIKSSGLLSDILLFFHEENLFSILSNDVRKYLESIFGPCLSFDDLISTVESLVCGNSTRSNQIRNDIRNQYQLVLIDESQDTDKTQWNIFYSLFITKEYGGNLFIIGDPKQSIYEWRKADLSAYLDIRSAFPSKHLLQMNVNYRSTPDLMRSINSFFSLKKPFVSIHSKETDTQKVINYCPSLPGRNEKPLSLPRNPIHFFLADSLEDAISSISQEALRLHNEYAIPFGDMAVLVSQNDHAFTFIRNSLLPTSLCKSKSIFSKTPSHSLLLILLEILWDPCNADKISAILSSCLFGYSSSKIQQRLEKEIGYFVELSEYLKTRKLISTFYKLMNRCGPTLLSTTSEGCLIYQEMESLSVYLEKLTPYPDQYLIYLKDLEELKEQEEDLQIHFSTEDKETVKITTIHSSKGLEYEIVFLLGLFPSSKKSTTESIHETYVAVTRAKRQVYIPINTKTKTSLFHNYIKDFSHDSAENFAKSLAKEHPESFSFSEKLIHSETHKEDLTGLLCPPNIFSLPHVEASDVLSFSKVYESHHSYFSSPTKDSESSPGGRSFGILVHEILEKLDFSIFVSAKTEDKIREILNPIVCNFTKNTPFHSYDAFITQIISKAFTTPITFKKDTFQLCEINPQKIFREEDFLTKDDTDNIWKGVIDLFFEYQGSYYLIDWKTTTLDNYDQKSLLEYVQHNNFDKQANIYLSATKKFLRQFDIQSSPEIAFIFLKGLHQGEGIFTF